MTTAGIPDAQVKGIENIDIWVPTVPVYRKKQELVKELRPEKQASLVVCLQFSASAGTDADAGSPRRGAASPDGRHDAEIPSGRFSLLVDRLMDAACQKRSGRRCRRSPHELESGNLQYG